MGLLLKASDSALFVFTGIFSKVAEPISVPGFTTTSRTSPTARSWSYLYTRTGVSNFRFRWKNLVTSLASVKGPYKFLILSRMSPCLMGPASTPPSLSLLWPCSVFTATSLLLEHRCLIATSCSQALWERGLSMGTT